MIRRPRDDDRRVTGDERLARRRGCDEPFEPVKMTSASIGTKLTIIFTKSF